MSDLSQRGVCRRGREPGARLPSARHQAVSKAERLGRAICDRHLKIIPAFCLALLVALDPAAGAAGQVIQTTTGFCSPAINNAMGPVSITCYGVDPKLLERLNQLLDRQNINPKEKVRRGDEWTRQYLELKTRLLLLSEQSPIARSAAVALERGDLAETGKELDQFIAQEESKANRQRTLLGQALASRAGAFALQFNYDAAFERCQTALQYAPDDAGILSTAGIIASRAGHYREAEQLLQRALTIRERTLGPNDRAVGESLSDLASLYRVEGRFAEAEPLLSRALTIRETTFGRDHPDVGESLNDLGAVYPLKVVTRRQSQYSIEPGESRRRPLVRMTLESLPLKQFGEPVCP
jgi:tetratricopeptide (TPR) repeat protein